MLIYEYKLDGNRQQYQAIDEAIRIVQFIRNKCLRKWMDGRGVSKNDLQCSCAVLAREYSFASLLNSQARQVAADRAWAAIARFYENCRNHQPGKKGYPRFQHDNRSVEYKTTGWVRLVCSKTVKTGEEQHRKSIPVTTDSLMMGAIPIPPGEKRNSILPLVATGHQSKKREEMGQSDKLDVTNTPSKLLRLAQANLCLNRRYR